MRAYHGPSDYSTRDESRGQTVPATKAARCDGGSSFLGISLTAILLSPGEPYRHYVATMSMLVVYRPYIRPQLSEYLMVSEMR